MSTGEGEREEKRVMVGGARRVRRRSRWWHEGWRSRELVWWALAKNPLGANMQSARLGRLD